MSSQPRFPSKLFVAISVASVVIFGFTELAVAKGDTLAAAKKRVQDAQSAANQAAKKLQEAQTKYDSLGVKISGIETDIANNETRSGSLKKIASQRAVEAYTSAYLINTPTPKDVLEVERRDILLAQANGQDRDEVNELAAINQDLTDQRAQLNAQRDSQRVALTNLRAQQVALKQKLELARAAQVRLEAALKRRRSYGGNGRGAYSGPAFIITPGSGSFICPIAGAMAHTNDWGAPRSGGRTHKGNDLFAARGVPNVAVAAGRLSFGNDRLGGNDAYVLSDSGIAYFYAHLDRQIGGPRRVTQGEVIGTVGSSGNARGGSPHTHFEIRIGGLNGTRVNPYPTVRAACGV